MNSQNITKEAVADTVARVRQLKRRVSPAVHPRIDACLDELQALYRKLATGQEPQPTEADSALHIVAFVAQLERTSLATPAASALSSRTPTSALRRIAQHTVSVETSSDGAAGTDDTPAPKSSTGRRAPVRDFFQRLHAGNQTRRPAKRYEAAWHISTRGDTEVRCEFTLRLVMPDSSFIPVPATGIYRTEDPYAAQMAFHTGADETVDWFFSRELLTAGTRTPAGSGDVRIWPAGGRARTPTVCIALGSEEGEALMEAPAGAIQAFLRASHRLIPPGEEHKHVNFDALPVLGVPPVDSP
ncbi:SsgA family sporulation/cell division regulator [Streptomyces anulatus]|uniref:SsgA family sporulation/cell division regulator n=2 Tax=Streptomyces anulatus TaxID=1892 RepID=A0ABZ1ZSM7_STRAQ|nr:SsgA family sporulation/cell division regulator [Streptomyces anulatus]WST90374.1 SsgA family sporulation/cell division regulator [Streptomyces anulatus]